MQPSSLSSSLVVAEGRAEGVSSTAGVKSIVVVEDAEDYGGEGSMNNGHSSNSELRRTVKLRRYNSNASSAGSPLTPSTVGSGPEEPPPPPLPQQENELQENEYRNVAADVQPASSAHLSQPGVLTTSVMVISAVALPEEQPFASSPLDTRSHRLHVELGAAPAMLSAAPASQRMAHTLRLQPVAAQDPSQSSSASSSLPHAQTQQQAEIAPPSKRLRLSLTTAAAATTTNSQSASLNSAERGRVLRLIPPILPHPLAASADDSGKAAPRAALVMEAHANEEQSLLKEKDTQALTCATATATTNAQEADAVGCVTAVEAPTPSVPTRPTPILIHCGSLPEGPASPSGVTSATPTLPAAPFSPHQQQPQSSQQQTPLCPPSSFAVATTATGSPSGASTTGGGGSGGIAFPRLRSLTPQPYAGAQGSPRRRHRRANVNLLSAPPPPQTELFHSFQRTVRDVYDVQEKLSEGTYGEVFKGVDKRTGAVVALKRLKMLSSHQGFPQTSLREVIALRHIQNQRERLAAGQRQHNNKYNKAVVADPLAEVAQLCDVLVFDRQQPDIVLVFAYATASLAGVLRRQLVFSPSELAYVMQKVLIAVRKLHEMSIIHRDIKLDNVLITSEGEVQLTDFGLCSIVSSGGTAPAWRTPSVITLAYRPPEMLLGSTAYDEKVDVWSFGCLLAQLYLYEPPFYRHRALQQGQQQQGQQGQSQRTAATELEQLSRITEVLGPLPSVRVFRPDACQHMRVLKQLEEQGTLAEAGKAAQPANWGRLQSLFEPSFLYQQFHGFRGWFEAEVQRSRHQPQRRPTQACLDVLCAALQLDPQQRPSAAELLRMPYFTTLDDAPLMGSYQRPLAATAEREEEVRRSFMMKVQRYGDSHTQRRPR